MAVFLTSRPFSGVRQIKYEQLLETNPDWVAEVPKDELEDYLRTLEQRYQSRCYQLVEDGLEKALAENPQIQGTAEHFALGKQLAEQAREIAMRELLDA